MEKNMNKFMVICFTVVMFLSVFVPGVRANVKLPAIISDNMVLQADKDIKIWGWADPKEDITVTIDKQKVNTKADDNGKWLIKLNPIKLGGPYEMAVTGKNTVIVKNILVGEVWFASGQSNMELYVSSSMNPEQEIKNANYPNIRLFNVSANHSVQPLEDVSGKWVECSPATVTGFSAVAYFFGRNIHSKLNVPVGLINSSYGATSAEAWTSFDALTSNISLKPMVNLYADLWEKFKGDGFKDKIEKINKDYKYAEELKIKDTGDTGSIKGWQSFDYDSSSWEEMSIPQQWEHGNLGNIDGVVWFRKEIEIPEDWQGEDLRIALGVINDIDTTYFNGNKVGETNVKTSTYWNVARKYKVPASIVKTGKNVIAVRVFNNFLSGGMVEPAKRIRIYKEKAPSEIIPLAGKWKYCIEYKVEQKPIPPNPVHFNTPTVLFNAMISPIINFSIKGVIWYQGENNANQAFQYRKLFPVMIEDWRKKWNDKFPFLFVQLANYLQRQPNPSASSWAELREAQLMTLFLPNTGIAVIIDIGDEKNIHPRNKQDVGLRLSLPALAKVYGKDIIYSGPIYKSMKIEGSKIKLSFEHIGGGLTIGNDTE